MKVWRILQMLERLAGATAELYERLHRRHADDPGAAALFARLREEEYGHRDIVRYEQRVMRDAPENWLELPEYDEAGLGETLRTVTELAERIDRLPLPEALRHALAIESAASQHHFRSVVERAHPALAMLVRNLGGEDRAQHRLLAGFAEQRGLPSEA